jgi:hypothetical protein
MSQTPNQLSQVDHLSSQNGLLSTWKTSLGDYNQSMSDIKKETTKNIDSAADATHLRARRESEGFRSKMDISLSSTKDALWRNVISLPRGAIPQLQQLVPSHSDSADSSSSAISASQRLVSQIQEQDGEIRRLAARAKGAIEQEQSRKNLLRVGALIVALTLIIIGWQAYQWASEQMALRSLYNSGTQAVSSGDFATAQETFASLARQAPNYQDVQTQLLESYYQPAVLAMDAGEWETARSELAELASLDAGYKDSRELLLESYYQSAVLAVDAGEWAAARNVLVHPGVNTPIVGGVM